MILISKNVANKLKFIELATRIVSKKKHKTGKTSGLKRLHAKGYFTKKGKFGVFKKKGKTAKKSKRCRHKSGPKKGKIKKCKTKKRRR